MCIFFAPKLLDWVQFDAVKYLVIGEWLCVRNCITISVCLSVRMSSYEFPFIYMHINPQTYTHMNKYIYVCMYVYSCVFVHFILSLNSYVYIDVCVCGVCAFMCVCARVCMCVQECVCSEYLQKRSTQQFY